MTKLSIMPLLASFLTVPHMIMEPIKVEKENARVTISIGEINGGSFFVIGNPCKSKVTFAPPVNNQTLMVKYIDVKARISELSFDEALGKHFSGQRVTLEPGEYKTFGSGHDVLMARDCLIIYYPMCSYTKALAPSANSCIEVLFHPASVK